MPIKKRLQAVKKLSDGNVYAYVFFGPVFPDIEIEDVKKYVQTFIDSGAKEIMVDSLHLKPGVWESISSSLPDKKREIFGERLKTNYYAHIFSEMEKECRGKVVLTKAFDH